MTFIKLLALIILCIIAVKVSRVAILAIRAGHSMSSIVISPIKRMWIWEYNTCRVLLLNLIYSKADIFKTLTDKNEVGKIREYGDYIAKNHILRGLFHLTWQTLTIVIITSNSWHKLASIFIDLKFNFITIIISVVIAAVYIKFKIVKIKPYHDTLIKSTMPYVADTTKIIQASITQESKK